MRGKGLPAIAGLPWRLFKAFLQSRSVLRRVRPQVVIGFGGGAAMDAAKAIVWFSQQSGINIETCVAIPTTSGTGSAGISVTTT